MRDCSGLHWFHLAIGGINMVTVTRLNGKELTVNCDVIECMEETPDTVITFMNGTKIVVKEKTSVIKKKIIEYKREIFCCMFENNRE